MSFIISSPEFNHILREEAVYFCLVKKTIAFFFFLLFSFQHLYALGYVGWFYSHQAAIAQKHCVNKDRPALKCNGKCFLSKKIKEAEQHQQEDRAKTEAPVFQLAPCEKETAGVTPKTTPAQPNYSLYQQAHYIFNRVVELLRPPGQTC